MQIVLILLGLVLILFNIRFIKSGDSTLLKKRLESKVRGRATHPVVDNVGKNFHSILESEKMDINEVDIMIGELRQEFSETLIGLQREIIELNDKIELILEAQSPMKTIDTIDMTEADFNMRTVVENSRIQDDIIIEDTSSDLDTAEFESRSFSKADQVGDLLNKGYSVDEICEKLQIGRGEVLLIQKLYQS